MMITDEQAARIRRLFYAEHWKVGTIATELALHHDTVRRAIGSAPFNRAAMRPVPPTLLDPYKGFIAETLAQHPRLRATRLLEMIKSRGYPGSAVQLRRYVACVRPTTQREAYFRLRTLPGEQAQVDWGHFGRIKIGHADHAQTTAHHLLRQGHLHLQVIRHDQHIHPVLPSPFWRAGSQDDLTSLKLAESPASAAMLPWPDHPAAL